MDFKNCHTTPITSIRAHCLECCAYNCTAVKGCTALNCPLFPYRLGKRPVNSKLVNLSVAVSISKR